MLRLEQYYIVCCSLHLHLLDGSLVIARSRLTRHRTAEATALATSLSRRTNHPVSSRSMPETAATAVACRTHEKIYFFSPQILHRFLPGDWLLAAGLINELCGCSAGQCYGRDQWPSHWRATHVRLIRVQALKDSEFRRVPSCTK